VSELCLYDKKEFFEFILNSLDCLLVVKRTYLVTRGLEFSSNFTPVKSSTVLPLHCAMKWA